MPLMTSRIEKRLGAMDARRRVFLHTTIEQIKGLIGLWVSRPDNFDQMVCGKVRSVRLDCNARLTVSFPRMTIWFYGTTFIFYMEAGKLVLSGLRLGGDYRDELLRLQLLGERAEESVRRLVESMPRFDPDVADLDSAIVPSHMAQTNHNVDRKLFGFRELSLSLVGRQLPATLMEQNMRDLLQVGRKWVKGANQKRYATGFSLQKPDYFEKGFAAMGKDGFPIWITTAGGDLSSRVFLPNLRSVRMWKTFTFPAGRRNVGVKMISDSEFGKLVQAKKKQIQKERKRLKICLRLGRVKQTY